MDPYDAGELLAGGGRAVLEVMLHKAAHALAVVRGVRDPSAESNRNHNKRFVALATEIGQPGRARAARKGGRQVRLPDSPTRRRPSVRTSSARSTGRGFPFLPAGYGAPQLDINAVSGQRQRRCPGLEAEDPPLPAAEENDSQAGQA
jgi:hypothetical protein